MRDDLNSLLDSIISSYQSGISASQLAKQYNCSLWSIITRLRKNSVLVRTKTQNCVYIANLTGQKQTEITELVDGLLLGDGSFDQKGFLRLEQAFRRKEWLEIISKRLEELGIEVKWLSRDAKTSFIEGRKIEGGQTLLLYTPSYTFLKFQRDRWYPEGRKAVPDDVNLTPKSLAYWFCGDGTSNGRGKILFCTHRYKEQEVDYLRTILENKFDIKSCRYEARPQQWVISINKMDEAFKLKELIIPFLPNCFLYKVKSIRPRKRMGSLTEGQVLKIREMDQEGFTKEHIAQLFGVSDSLIRDIIRGKIYKYY